MSWLMIIGPWSGRRTQLKFEFHLNLKASLHELHTEWSTRKESGGKYNAINLGETVNLSNDRRRLIERARGFEGTILSAS